MPHTREAPDLPSPRTLWSAFNKKEIGTWETCHAALRVDAQAYQPYKRSTQLVLLGDSITESWRGTSYGRVVPRTKGVPQVLSDTLGERWPMPLALGIAADCTQHLLWRMMHGELSAAMGAAPRLIFVLLIGKNNLGKGHSPDETVSGVVACAEHILNQTRGKLLINALLPRGDRRKRGRNKGRGYMADIETVNAGLNVSVATRLSTRYATRAHFVDCGRPYLLPHYSKSEAGGGGGGKDGGKDEIVDRTLMPDRLHPNAAGHKKWASCLERKLTEISQL